MEATIMENQMEKKMENEMETGRGNNWSYIACFGSSGPFARRTAQNGRPVAHVPNSWSQHRLGARLFIYTRTPLCCLCTVKTE